ncbi:hypothetical protein NUW54_g8589 [Trametes sanguinea]|uniref:Uncharacterized protein n=1 Tax=Trametes sanguinea TaxID=158606 RepID=A0ACC1PFE8_9APHY|nr:hypothetical protein NUW54_g8589 [Trametes sanguinea]
MRIGIIMARSSEPGSGGLAVSREMQALLDKPGFLSETATERFQCLPDSVNFNPSLLSEFAVLVFIGALGAIKEMVESGQVPDLAGQETGYKYGYAAIALFGAQRLASEPVGQPAIYDPSKPKGQRWSTAGFDTSSIARLYHSSAILLPDASVLIAGSNPNVDVNLTAPFPTTYKAEVFYPSYFAAPNRPSFTGLGQLVLWLRQRRR